MEATASSTLHITSSAISLITCLVILIYLLHPAYMGSAQLFGLRKPATASPQTDCLLAVSDGWWQRTPPGIE